MLWEILKASKGILVADFYADLWANIAGGGTPVDVFVEMIGSPPLYYNGKGYDLTDYLISGNAVQDGTPTPEAPVDVVGCGVRTGNLFDAATAYGAMYSGGVITGSAGDINGIKNKVTADMIGKTYTISITSLKIPSRAFLSIIVNGTTYWRENELAVNQRSSFQFTPVTENDQWYITYDTGDVSSYKDIMLNTGSTALSYEPYGYKLPLTVNGVEYPIYLGQVETTRRVKKLVLTGEEETWDTISGNAPYRIQLPDIVQTSDRNIVLFTSSHYCAVSNNAFWNRYTTCVSWAFSGGVNVKCLVFRDRNQATLADFKSYLAAQYANGTPVTVWYVLAEPETAIVNEPLMKIGDYADTISFAQSQVVIPTVNGANVLDMTSPVKPSEVYIKGKGIKPMEGGS